MIKFPPIKKLIFIILYLNTPASANEIKQLSEQTITETFGPEVRFAYNKITITDSLRKNIAKRSGQAFYQSSVICWQVCQKDSLVGFALLDNVPGKALPITFLVLIDPFGRIKKIAVIKYREAYGGAVTNPVWLRQFEGKDSDSEYEIGNHIDAISGATISVNSLTRGIHKLTILFKQHIINTVNNCHAGTQ